MTTQPFGKVSDLESWFQKRHWKPFAFQRQCWSAYEKGQDILLHSSTGSGKTLAAWLGPVRQFLRMPSVASFMDSSPAKTSRAKNTGRRKSRTAAPPLTVLWITPLRALSADTEAALRQPIDDLALPWTLERRTGDSSSSVKNRQRKLLPTALIITPESLSLLLSYPASFQQFAALKCIVVDEWHELMGTKRGTQCELALARLKKLAPQAVRIGLSATLGNLEQAMQCLIGADYDKGHHRLIQGAAARKIEVESLLPESIQSFPWAGHLGLKMVDQVIPLIQDQPTTLLFTNTRNQAEHWYQELLQRRPDWAGQLALHHGSLDRGTRQWVEQSVRTGKLLAVVCTSSLDLGVDFPSVKQVIQIGSPKSVARVIQRAGRSQHQPGKSSRLWFAPTNQMELIELASAKQILLRKDPVESRSPLECPLDCLAQHAVTLALASPYSYADFRDEVRHCYSYRNLQDDQLKWIFHYLVQGGDSLQAYPEFHRVQYSDGRYQVADPRIARLHRMSIGTISSDMGMEVKYLTGKRIGMVEERFASRLRPGQTFQFAGRSLELVHLREGTAWVRRSRKSAAEFPSWAGGRLPLSSELCTGIRDLLHQASQQQWIGPEMRALTPMLKLQSERSVIPARNQWLVEGFQIRKKSQWAFFPLEGRLVHEGLAALIAQRLSQQQPMTIAMAVNDFGFLLETSIPIDLNPSDLSSVFSINGIEEDIEKSLNATEMAKRSFREIARIAGLIHPGYPGQPKRARHLQAASNLFFEVFQTYDSENRFLQQARDEVLEQQLQWQRLRQTLQRLQQSEVLIQRPTGYTPFAFPLVVERMRDGVSTETLDQRILRLLKRMEA